MTGPASPGPASGPLAGLVPEDATSDWVGRWAPAFLRPYLRLARADRPIGSWLLLIPCWWSTAMALRIGMSEGAALPGYALALLALFALGSVAMRGAGCTWNDILDRDIDGKVERTRGRPLPSGQVGLVGAFLFLGIQALVGLAVLLCLPPFAIGVALSSLGVVAIYPLMKRIIWIPQLVLGLAFSWGALMGFAALLERLPASAFLLYAGSILWVVGYDTIYAHQDREDDALVGVKSSARLFERNTHPWLAGFYAGAVGLFALALWSAGSGLFAWGGLALFALQLGWQVRRLDIDDRALCLRLFRSNRDAGLLLFAGMMLDLMPL
ncbi:4-hydroxybenzoate polyprenyltransferase [Angulomicrobium tetraedrale]|uniref:4-hydroxybenzoate octaprenyltransferase n=1 Tax=Ancylobacter tetraedralis TaxID=217068 RepID=A0A839ZF57_9HYPH|nr:4-hydroxybenzoate octaprenyltransferase [Ancylobacter tetraedralis]MBB3773286.1 4-hydroxybenzoate polyprenyltransferase [Ancylobacter tetraedralis]